MRTVKKRIDFLNTYPEEPLPDYYYLIETYKDIKFLGIRLRSELIKDECEYRSRRWLSFMETMSDEQIAYNMTRPEKMWDHYYNTIRSSKRPYKLGDVIETFTLSKEQMDKLLKNIS